MRQALSRALLAAAALLMAAGSAIHAAAYPKVAPLFDAASLSAFLAGASKALWLADSSNVLVLGLAFGLVASRPDAARPSLLIILATAPLASAILIYMAVGPFFAGHLMLIVSLLVLASAVLNVDRPSRDSVQERRGTTEGA